MPVRFKPHTQVLICSQSTNSMNWCNDNHYSAGKTFNFTYSNFKRRFIRCLIPHTLYSHSVTQSVFCLAVPMNKRARAHTQTRARAIGRNKKQLEPSVFCFAFENYTYTHAALHTFYFLANDTTVAPVVLVLSLSLLLLSLLLLIVM